MSFEMFELADGLQVVRHVDDFDPALDDLDTRIGGTTVNGFTTNDMTRHDQAAPAYDPPNAQARAVDEARARF